MEIRSIAAVYLARDHGTGVALIRGEDKPPRGALIDFMEDFGLIKPGAVVPVCWQQIWDYRGGQEEVPALFRWQQFVDWLREWPAELEQFHQRWRRLFGRPEDNLADAAVVIWEER